MTDTSTRQIIGIAAASVLTMACASAQAPTVARNMADPSACSWRASAWNSAAGALESSPDRPAESGVTAGSLRITADYSGQGFEFFSVEPAQGAIPGACGKVAAWVKTDTDQHSWAVKFKDAKGKEEVNGKKLEMSLKTKAGQWVRSEFAIPSEWEQPLTLASIAGHNWNVKTTKARASILVHDLRVTTGVAGISDRKTLVNFSMTGPTENNVLIEGEPATWTIAADSWLGAPLSGTLDWKATDEQGNTLTGGARKVSFTETVSETIRFQPRKYGVYGLAVDIRLGGEATFSRVSRMAYIPKPAALTDAEKAASPYGINIHGGMPGVPYKAVARTGFAWVRDYAYAWDWMLRAKGDDGRYGGWPWYPKMDKKARDAGLMVLPCLMRGIGQGVEAGRLEPDRQWKTDLLHILMTFPQYRAWELDNEYDLHHTRQEEERGWSSYNAYHRMFGDTAHVLDESVLAVENGTAGLHPARVRESIRSGAFDRIDVVNGHFYCGLRPPELSRRNVNIGEANDTPMLISDNIRELVRAARSDGRKRRTWVTEFGWDTLAVHVVSEREQAAYLQRGFLMGLHGGLDKMFWYWDRDTKGTPANFFDGCGIFDAREEPKPAVVAMAALVQRLRQPEPVGTCDFGSNTLGYVFRDRGRFTACAFKVDPNVSGPTVEFAKGSLFDMFGNPLSGRRQTLDTPPVWIEDVPETDPMVIETAFDIDSLRYVRATAGDPFAVRVRARNIRKTPLKAEFAVSAPSGWTISSDLPPITLSPGQDTTNTVRIIIDPKAPAGAQSLAISVRDSGTEKILPVEVEVLAYATLRTKPLTGTSGRSKLEVSVRNNSLQTRSFLLKPAVPRGWTVEPATISLNDVPPETIRTAEFMADWNTAWKPDESAEVAALTSDGQRIAAAPVSPGAIPLPTVESIRFDGDLADWPVSARLPRWGLGCDGGQPDADIYAGWSKAGLCIATVVHNSKVEVRDPRTFWGGDCLEVFVDTANNKTPRKPYQATDHQFWFCPMVKDGKVYAGRWKRSNEIPATMYDIREVNGACRKTSDGYIMEAMLPASLLRNFASIKDGRIGLNLNLTVQGKSGSSREVYWPNSKADWVQYLPHIWGIGELK